MTSAVCPVCSLQRVDAQVGRDCRGCGCSSTPGLINGKLTVALDLGCALTARFLLYPVDASSLGVDSHMLARAASAQRSTAPLAPLLTRARPHLSRCCCPTLFITGPALIQ
jgi:hypothetical protein